MIIKWTDEINSFDKHKFIHKEKLIKQRTTSLFLFMIQQQLCYFRQNKNFSTNLLVGLFGNKIEKLFIYYMFRKKWLLQKVLIWIIFLRNQ